MAVHEGEDVAWELEMERSYLAKHLHIRYTDRAYTVRCTNFGSNIPALKEDTEVPPKVHLNASLAYYHSLH